MKDFTTIEYIRPVIDEFLNIYKNVTTEYYKKALNCDLLFEHKKFKHNATAIRKDQPFNFYGKTVRELEKQIKDYSEYAATEPGELDTWLWNEEKRVQNAIRDELLKMYT